MNRRSWGPPCRWLQRVHARRLREIGRDLGNVLRGHELSSAEVEIEAQDVSELRPQGQYLRHAEVLD